MNCEANTRQRIGVMPGDIEDGVRAEAEAGVGSRLPD
jgi:hypothetical protein